MASLTGHATTVVNKNPPIKVRTRLIKKLILMYMKIYEHNGMQ